MVMIINKRAKRKKSKNKYKKKLLKDQKMNSVECQKNDEVQEVVKEGSADDEQRRTTRSGAVLAIVVVIGTICMVGFRLCVNILNVWAVQGFVYRCLQFSIITAFSILIILFCRLVTYIIYDLMRYNLSDKNCGKYDMKSDTSYDLLVCDFKFYLTLLTVVLVVIIVVLCWKEGGIYRIVGGLSGIVLLVGGICYVKERCDIKKLRDIKKLCKK